MPSQQQPGSARVGKVYVELTDTFDMWRQKTNAMMDVVYSLTGSGSISISNPQDAQILVYNSSTFAFRNVSMYGDVTMDSNTGHTHISATWATSKGRMRFAGSMRSLY